MGGGITLEPPRGPKPWAAMVRLTPAMLTCLEGAPGRAQMTLNPTGDATLRIGDNSFTFATIPEDVPGDLIRGSLEKTDGSDDDASLRVVGSLRCRLQPKRALSGHDGLAARVKRRVEEESGEMRARRTMVTEFVAPNREDEKTKNKKTKHIGAPAKKITKSPPRPGKKTTEEAGIVPEKRLPIVTAPPARVSERLAQLAASASKAASSRAANQLRAAVLTTLASRPLSSAAVWSAVSTGLHASGVSIPHRTVFDGEVKKVAALKSPGKYHLLDQFKTEATELLAAAEMDVPDFVTTPPLCIPEPQRITRDNTELAGLTDDEREEHGERFGVEGQVSECAAGDETNEDGQWRDAAERCTRAMGLNASGSSYIIQNDTQFQSLKSLYHREYATYLAMHAALDSNAREFSSVHKTDKRSFMEIRKKRYGAMAASFDALEKQLKKVKQSVVQYAERKKSI